MKQYCLIKSVRIFNTRLDFLQLEHGKRYNCVYIMDQIITVVVYRAKIQAQILQEKKKNWVWKYWKSPPQLLFCDTHWLFYLLMKDDGMFVFILVFIVFKMATGTGIAALPRTTMSRSPRSPSASSWLSSTTILCPCPRTQTQLMKSYPSKRGRSLGWEFWVDLVRYYDILCSWLIQDFLGHICMEDGTCPNQK